MDTPKPDIVEQEYLEYLDDLRDSGDTNMFEARTYLEDKFSLSREDARTILNYWMNTFSKRHPQGKSE